jgi:thiamine pyrophosphate-dependent acetolactate synthase large subunit-like protein
MKIGTAARFNINAIVLVNDHDALNQASTPSPPPTRASREAGRPQCGTSAEVNFAQVAEAMGGADIRVGRPEDIRPALEKAMASNGRARRGDQSGRSTPSPNGHGDRRRHEGDDENMA